MAGNFVAGDGVFLVTEVGEVCQFLSAASGQAVHTLVAFAAGLFFHEEPAFREVPDISMLEGGDFLFREFDRQRFRGCGCAIGTHRAEQAGGTAGGADGLPKLHEG